MRGLHFSFTVPPAGPRKRTVAERFEVKSYTPNSSTYASRISNDEWLRHHELLKSLHEEGVSRASMHERLQSQGFHPSLHQLNMKMTEWGYRVYRRHRPRDLTSNAPPTIQNASSMSLPQQDQPVQQEMSATENAPLAEKDDMLISSPSPVDALSSVDVNCEKLLPSDVPTHVEKDTTTVMLDMERLSLAESATALNDNASIASDQQSSALSLDYKCPGEWIEDMLKCVADEESSIDDKRKVLQTMGRFLHNCQWHTAAFKLRYQAYLLLRTNPKPDHFEIRSLLVELSCTATSDEDRETVRQELADINQYLHDTYDDHWEGQIDARFIEWALRDLKIGRERESAPCADSVLSYVRQGENRRHLDHLLPTAYLSLSDEAKDSYHQQVADLWDFPSTLFQFIINWCYETTCNAEQSRIIDIDPSLFPSFQEVPPVFVSITSQLLVFWVQKFCSDVGEHTAEQDLSTHAMCDPACTYCLSTVMRIMSDLSLLAVCLIKSCTPSTGVELRPKSLDCFTFEMFAGAFKTLGELTKTELSYKLCEVDRKKYMLRLKDRRRIHAEERLDDLGALSTALTAFLMDLVQVRCVSHRRLSDLAAAQSRISNEIPSSVYSNESRDLVSLRRLAKRIRYITKQASAERLRQISWDRNSSHSSWRLSFMSSIRSSNSLIRAGA